MLAAVITAASIFFIRDGLPFNTQDIDSTKVSSLAKYSTSLDSPTGPGAMSPRFTAINNQLFMIWLEPNQPDQIGSRSLWHIKSSRWQKLNNAWSQPATIHSSRQLFINWSDAPSITATPNGRLYTHWLEKNKLNVPYAYDIQLAYSDDGLNWHAMGTASVEQAPHNESYDGFLSFLPTGDNTRAFWISARSLPGGKGEKESRKKMTLQTALLDQNVQQNQMLDGDICSCCNTTTIQAATGPIIFYRNHTSDEIRDIYYVRLADGLWSEPTAVHHDNWEINGCPVNGPKAVTNGELIAVAWFTAATGKPQVKLSWSSDDGKRFITPIDIDTLSPSGPTGQIGLVMTADGQAIISWIGNTGLGKHAAIFLRQLDASGATTPYFKVAHVDPGRATGIPQLALLNDQLFVSWTVVSQKQKKIVMVKIPIEALGKSI